MKLYFIHSRMQLAIYSQVGTCDDLVVMHRSLNVPESFLTAKHIYKFKQFALADLSVLHKVLRIIRQQFVTEVIFPHSHSLNRVLPFILFFEGSVKISYIEDGAATWRFLKEHESLPVVNNSIKGHFLLMLKVTYLCCLRLDSRVSLKILSYVGRTLQKRLPASKTKE